jgi:hypothetical protein
MKSIDVDRAIKYAEQRLSLLRSRGDQPSINERNEMANILAVIKSLTGRK